MVLASCNKFHSKTTGTIRVLDDAMLDLMKTAIKKMADNALRTIVLAYKELKDSDEMETKNNLGVYDIETKDLVCISIFGIKDILREEVPGAVKQCNLFLHHLNKLIHHSISNWIILLQVKMQVLRFVWLQETTVIPQELLQEIAIFLRRQRSHLPIKLLKVRMP